jgi:hypothetical protein
MMMYDPRTGAYTLAQPVQYGAPASGYAAPSPVSYPGATPVSYDMPYRSAPAYAPAVQRLAVPQRTPSRVVERQSGRDWKKTALVIGGSTATAAGVGAIFGGKKGALIGAAIGGGASTLWEAKH